MKSVILRLIRAYQAYSRSAPSSPIFFGGYSGCRSWPTCSDYALDAIENNGVVRGSFRAFIRFVRCNPLTSHSRV